MAANIYPASADNFLSSINRLNISDNMKQRLHISDATDMNEATLDIALEMPELEQNFSSSCEEDDLDSLFDENIYTSLESSESTFSFTNVNGVLNSHTIHSPETNSHTIPLERVGNKEKNTRSPLRALTVPKPFESAAKITVASYLKNIKSKPLTLASYERVKNPIEPEALKPGKNVRRKTLSPHITTIPKPFGAASKSTVASSMKDTREVKPNSMPSLQNDNDTIDTPSASTGGEGVDFSPSQQTPAADANNAGGSILAFQVIEPQKSLVLEISKVCPQASEEMSSNDSSSTQDISSINHILKTDCDPPHNESTSNQIPSDDSPSTKDISPMSIHKTVRDSHNTNASNGSDPIILSMPFDNTYYDEQIETSPCLQHLQDLSQLSKGNQTSINLFAPEVYIQQPDKPLIKRSSKLPIKKMFCSFYHRVKHNISRIKLRKLCPEKHTGK